MESKTAVALSRVISVISVPDYRNGHLVSSRPGLENVFSFRMQIGRTGFYVWYTRAAVAFERPGVIGADGPDAGSAG